jgi:membrane protease YdiL (CAAX protease family)
VNNQLNTKRILIFLAIVIGVSWAVALLISTSSLMETSPTTAMSLANYIIIMTPALANIVTRLITKEGWKNLWLRPNFRRGWRYYLAAWLLPLLAVVVGAAAYYLFFPESFDPSLSSLQKLYAGSPAAAANPWTIMLTVILQSMVLAVPINAVVSLGEEFGWRAYLLQKLMTHFSSTERAGASAEASASAARKASLVVGLIWGMWHWPLIFMSMRIDPSIPLAYPLVYLLSTTAMSVLLCWVTLRSGSVWPASIGHGAINAYSGLVGFMLKGQPNMLLGPMTGSLIGSVGFYILALVLLTSRNAFVVEDVNSEPVPADAAA